MSSSLSKRRTSALELGMQCAHRAQPPHKARPPLLRQMRPMTGSGLNSFDSVLQLEEYIWTPSSLVTRMHDPLITSDVSCKSPRLYYIKMRPKSDCGFSLPQVGDIVEYPLRSVETEDFNDGRTHGVGLLVGRNMDRGELSLKSIY